MSLTLTGEKVKIYAKERTWSGGSFMTYSMSVSSKDKNGNWNNAYLDCEFKKADAEKITNKCVIKINNAFPTITVSKDDRKYVKWFINDFEVTEQGESAAIVNGDDFMNIPDNIDEEVPWT